MQNTRHTDNNPRSLSGLPTEPAPSIPHWEKLSYSYQIVIGVHCQSIIITTREFVPLIFYIPYKYIMLIPYRRKVCCDYYMCSLIDADFKSYTGIPCGCSPHVPYWRFLPIIIYEPCKYAFPNSHMEKVTYDDCTSYLVDADYKSYLGLSYDCSPNVLYWRTMLFIICEPYICIHTETYRRKVIFLFTYIYNSMLYVLESRNIFKILINSVNRTIHSTLTTSTHV